MAGWPVLRPLAEGIDPSESLDERIALNLTMAALVRGQHLLVPGGAGLINGGANEGALQRWCSLIAR